MKEYIVGKLSELVFHLDEVYHSVARRYSHVTLLACISAMGDALTPKVIMAVAFPGYTTNISQALDLVFLGAMKC
jgi:hypothetical protein